MPITLYESGLKEDKKSEKLKGSNLEGIVLVPCDLLRQGKALVRIPALGQEVWARLSAPGAGKDAGNFYTPREDDEVLVGFTDNDPNSAYIINSLWSTGDNPPISKNPLDLDVTTKRVIRTGLKGGIGHEIEFDDGVNQSITITTSTQQKIVMDKEKIELRTIGGTAKITLDLAKQTVSIQAPQIEIGGTKTVSLKLSASRIEIAGKTETVITGQPVRIN
jgi:uncharacterized protein involved in type VI secretion and phage assembly